MSTISLSMKPAITYGIGVPRAAYLRFPLGNPFGEKHKPALQRAILLELLRQIEHIREPRTIVPLPFRWRRGRIRMSRQQHKAHLEQLYDTLSEAVAQAESYRDLLRTELAAAEPGSEEAERLERLVELTTKLAQTVDEGALTMTMNIKDLMFAVEEMRAKRFW